MTATFTGTSNTSATHPAPGSLAEHLLTHLDTTALAVTEDPTGEVLTFTATGAGEGAHVALHVRDFDAELTGNGWALTLHLFTPHEVVAAAFSAAAARVGVAL